MPIDGKDQGRRGRDRQGGVNFLGKNSFPENNFRKIYPNFPEIWTDFPENLNKFSWKRPQIFLKKSFNLNQKSKIRANFLEKNAFLFFFFDPPEGVIFLKKMTPSRGHFL